MLFKRNFSITRRFKRQWFNTSVRVFTDRGQMDAWGINLSEGGMGLFAVAHLNVGSRIEIEFCPPEASQAVRVEATVRHRALYLYGIEFLPQADQLRDSRPRHNPAHGSASC
jgi:hypothetical protein